MTVRISVWAKDGSRIEVSVGATSCMRVEIVSDRARVVVGDDAGASLRVSMTGRSRSEDAERARGGSGAGTVSAEMEAAAVAGLPRGQRTPRGSAGP